MKRDSAVQSSDRKRSGNITLLADPTTLFSDDELWKKSQRSEEKVIHRALIAEHFFDVGARLENRTSELRNPGILTQRKTERTQRTQRTA